MKSITIAAISLSNRDYPDLEAKFSEAVSWLELAAQQGADLAVLPEMLNVFQGDGGAPCTCVMQPCDDWQQTARQLLDAASRLKIAVTIPLWERRGGTPYNCFHLVDRTGRCVGTYDKRFPTSEERRDGVVSGSSQPIPWEGTLVGGAICFDTNFQEVFRDQWRQGARLFLVPSLWPGGTWLNHYALRYSCPIALAYPAWSRIIGVDGRELAAGGYRNETLRFGHGSPVCMATVNLDTLVVHAAGAQHLMRDIMRKHGRSIRISFDQQNCLFTLESQSHDLPIADVAREFGLIALQQFLDRHGADTGP